MLCAAVHPHTPHTHKDFTIFHTIKILFIFISNLSLSLFLASRSFIRQEDVYKYRYYFIAIHGQRHTDFFLFCFHSFVVVVFSRLKLSDFHLKDNFKLK